MKPITPQFVLSVDPGVHLGLAILRVTGQTITLHDHLTMTLPGMTEHWLKHAVSVAMICVNIAERIRKDFGADPFIVYEWPFISSKFTSGTTMAQVAFCAAFEAMMTAKGWPVAERVNPLTSKKALTGLGRVPRVPGVAVPTMKDKKEAQVKWCKLRSLWPTQLEPSTNEERWALADAISHALVMARRLTGRVESRPV